MFRKLTLTCLLVFFSLICSSPWAQSGASNLAPDCSGAFPSATDLWPPNHSMVPVDVLGVTDPDGDPISISIQCILQDEPVNGTGDGNTEPDGGGIGTSTAQVRRERAGPGDGRVYHIDYIATDSHGAQCGGEVTVNVRHGRHQPAVAARISSPFPLP